MAGMLPVVQIGFRTSGIDSGELDYSVKLQRLKRLSQREFEEVLRLLDEVKESVSFKWKKRGEWEPEESDGKLQREAAEQDHQ